MPLGPIISRRQFLRRAGSFVALAGLPGIEGQGQTGGAAARAAERINIAGTSLGLPSSLDPTPVVGRALRLLDLRSRPDAAAPVVGKVQPQSVSAIGGLSTDGWWYTVLDGYVPRELMQPILPYTRPAPSDMNGYHEVVSPVTQVRQFCAGHAPIVAHVGFGGTLYVHDRLTDDRQQVWYAVTGSESGQGFYGWASGPHLRRWQADSLTVPGGSAAMPADLTLWIDPKGCKLSAYDGERLIGETAIYAGPMLRGPATLHVDAPGAWVTRTPFVRPWLMRLQPEVRPAVQVYGAFWHNRFGIPCSGPHLELPIFAARWLYHALLHSPNHQAAVIIE